MATPTRHTSPKLVLKITEEIRERAIQASSGGCLMADAIRTQYPRFEGIAVDMATVRFTDRKAGLRYTYLTPESGQTCLLAFDQGWDNPYDEVVLKRAVQIVPVKRNRTGPTSAAGIAERRPARIAELEAKEAAGPLTGAEKRALGMLRNPKPTPERPSSTGPADVVMVETGGTGRTPVIYGGRPLIQRQRDPNPNLLKGRNRIFGAKSSRPSVPWEKAVAKAAAEVAEAMVAERFGTRPAE